MVLVAHKHPPRMHDASLLCLVGTPTCHRAPALLLPAVEWGQRRAVSPCAASCLLCLTCPPASVSCCACCAVLAPGSVLPPGRRIPSGQLWAGSPAKYVRDLTKDEVRHSLHGVALFGAG